MKILDPDSGEEVEVFTAAEVTARETTAADTARAAKDAEFAPVKTELEEKLADASTRLQERTGEFTQFRKLRDEDVAKLGVAEKTIYENGLALEEERQRRITAETANQKTAIANVIAAKAGTNEKLKDEMTKMWDLIGVQATTPDELETKAGMVLGALSTTMPDLVATANGFTGGTFQPPQIVRKEGESFADTPEGKAGADELGLVLEVPKA